MHPAKQWKLQVSRTSAGRLSSQRKIMAFAIVSYFQFKTISFSTQIHNEWKALLACIADVLPVSF